MVTNVVDGDTIDVVGTAEGTVRIRVIGIDTPEMKTCGGQPAKDAMSALAMGKCVILTAVSGKDDTDRYGRLLRYVDLPDGTDGLTLIQQGHAIARYDLRDGYGAHPHEESYIAADAAAPDYACAPVTPTSTPTPTTTPESTECNYKDPPEIVADILNKEADTNGDCHMSDEEFRIYMDAYSARRSTEESAYYANCDEARAAGAAPLYVGEPGYAPKLDRDKDGVACESS